MGPTLETSFGVVDAVQALSGVPLSRVSARSSTTILLDSKRVLLLETEISERPAVLKVVGKSLTL